MSTEMNMVDRKSTVDKCMVDKSTVDITGKTYRSIVRP